MTEATMTGESLTGKNLAAAASRLAGTRFAPHGRDPETGVDCLGLLLAAMAACGERPALSAHYSVRRRGEGDALATAMRLGLIDASGPVEPGDVLLVRCSPVHVHVLIALGGDRFVHAHAGLGKVVVGASDPDWPLLRHWRLSPSA